MANEENGSNMEHLVGTMVRALVDDPKSVFVVGVKEHGCLAVHIEVAPADVGKLIGKHGRTARSLRTIVSAAGSRNKVRCEINIAGSGNRDGEAQG